MVPISGLEIAVASNIKSGFSIPNWRPAGLLRHSSRDKTALGTCKSCNTCNTCKSCKSCKSALIQTHRVQLPRKCRKFWQQGAETAFSSHVGLFGIPVSKFCLPVIPACSHTDPPVFGSFEYFFPLRESQVWGIFSFCVDLRMPEPRMWVRA